MNETDTETVLTVILKSSADTELINNKYKDCFELIEDTPIEDNPELELIKFLEPSESYIKGDVMFDRAKRLGNRAGQQHLERLLAQHDSIPEEWRPYYLVAPGTKCRLSVGDLIVPCLYWRGGKWGLIWDWLGRQWRSNDRLVRCK